MGDQNPSSQVASASLPWEQLDQTTLKEVAMDLGCACSSVGGVAFWIVASDSDNDKLTYGISGLYASYFSVDPDTGAVKLVSPLDYEVKDGGVGKAWGRGAGRVALGARVPGAWLGSGTEQAFVLSTDTSFVQYHHLRE